MRAHRLRRHRRDLGGNLKHRRIRLATSDKHGEQDQHNPMRW